MRAAMAAAVVIIAAVVCVSEARHRTCQRKAFWRFPFKKNNRISRDVFENVIATGRWFNLYTIEIGDGLGPVQKGEHRFRMTADGTVNYTISAFVVEEGGCVEFTILHDVSEKKVCRYGTEKYIQMDQFGGSDGRHAIMTHYSQDPSKYIMTRGCFELGHHGKCISGIWLIQIRDIRGPPRVLGSEVDLSLVPWHLVAYDLYRLTGLKFGDPRVRYAWLGTECQLEE